MRRFMNVSIWAMIIVAVCLSGFSWAGDTAFTCMDMAPGAFPSKGVEPTPFIVWSHSVPIQYRARLLTIEESTGRQLGSMAEFDISSFGEPVANLWAREFSMNPNKGVEPSPFIIFRNFHIVTFPVYYDIDGTPLIGAIEDYALSVDSTYGHPTCIGETTGIIMHDDIPRLVIGTDLGYLIMVTSNVGAAPLAVDSIYHVSNHPIRAIKIVPQLYTSVLGVLTDNILNGFVFLPPPNKGDAKNYAYVFSLSYQGVDTITDFASPLAYGDPITDPGETIPIILAFGTDHIGVAQISGTIHPSNELIAAQYNVRDTVRAICSGSLLMLTGDNAQVIFDPGFTPETGPGPCAVDIGDAVADDCGYVCGDANGDLVANVGDAVFLISYAFRDGIAPYPTAAGDANCDGEVNVGDVVYIINFVFRSGDEPCCP